MNLYVVCMMLSLSFCLWGCFPERNDVGEISYFSEELGRDVFLVIRVDDEYLNSMTKSSFGLRDDFRLHFGELHLSLRMESASVDEAPPDDYLGSDTRFLKFGTNILLLRGVDVDAVYFRLRVSGGSWYFSSWVPLSDAVAKTVVCGPFHVWSMSEDG